MSDIADCSHGFIGGKHCPDCLRAKIAEAAAFLDNMAGWVSADEHWHERSRMAADCRVMAAKLMRGET